ncbi:rRNA methyltransferase 3A, mitochondrial [Electrophorus electricus]|uniref:RNA 2-O ribose methyltransferase substrate binding domain-containing protein n=1 Tax=Electrophorus electricus TaxID=8005 RepID=A0A4W4DV75_ELEEL|nr:rRNA methyltransferase 3A, mitochondrial [Electrophorus electricus]
MAALIGGVKMGRGSLLRATTVLLETERSVRALRRKPVAVIHPDGKRETLIKSNLTADETKQKQERGRPPKRNALETGRTAGTSTDDERTLPVRTPGVKDQSGHLKFEKALPGDTRLAKVASVARSRSFREQQGRVLLEGRRLICDALRAGAAPQMLFFSRVEKLRELPLHELRHATLIKVKFEDIKMWSDLVSPQGVIAIFSKPDASCLTFPRALRQQSVPLSLICDNVQDAGTLGTLLRCAAAAGCDRALLTKGCVDAWEPKVLRAAMGAHFHLPILADLDWDDVVGHLPELLTIHVVDNSTMAIRCMVTGVVQKVGEAALVCGGTSNEEHVESTSEDEELPLRLEPQAYHENWAQSSTALVVAGDTHGPSWEALRLVGETGGRKLFIPTDPGVDCLNAAMAASILLFEGRRQLLSAQKAPRRGPSEVR